LNSATKWLVDYKNKSSLNTNEYRLPNNLVPSDYVLFIQPDFTLTSKPEKFNANIKITFKCISDTNKLVLHAEELTFNKSTLTLNSSDDSNFTQIKGFDYSINNQTNLLTASLSQSFKKDKVYELYVEYEGKYFTDNLGFYSNSYNNDKNETNWMVSSQFEPVKARRAMPCFDEPAFKSTFKLTVKHHSSLKAISNMPSISVKST
jgi:aminopeptidase N